MLDGEDDPAAAASGGGAEEGALDGAEAALAGLEGAAESVGGAAELLQVEHPQPLRASLLRQLLYAPPRRRHRRSLAALLPVGFGRRRLGRCRGANLLLFIGLVLAALEGEAPHLITNSQGY